MHYVFLIDAIALFVRPAMPWPLNLFCLPAERPPCTFVSMLRFLTSCLMIVMLTGCPAGMAPIVGYPTGKTSPAPNLICSSNAGLHALRLYEQRIDCNYRLLFSPEGGRKDYPLRKEHRYFVQTGSEPLRELSFLRTDSSKETFDQIHPIDGTSRWVGFGRCLSAPIDDSGFTFLPGSDERAHQTSRYFVTVFDQDRIVARREVVTMARRPDLRYLSKLHAVQFKGPLGRMAYFIDDNRVSKFE